MKAILLIDFGSTYTKLTAVDVEAEVLLGTASAFTTIETDINDGLEAAMAKLQETTGPISYDACYACSSAAGGLRMITSGLVPELTGEAAKLASLGAGAKVAGAGIAIEKGFQEGGKSLRADGYKIASMAIVESMSDTSLTFRKND